MRGETDREKIERFMVAFAQRVRGAGRIYFTGGGSAVLYGWRAATIDLDLKADPEPPQFYEAIAELKETIDLNVELASPDDFLPPLPGWRERSIFIARHAALDFYHYDLYAQALAKIERGHGRDLADVEAMLARALISRDRSLELFVAIEPQLIRYPAVDPVALRTAVVAISGAGGVLLLPVTDSTAVANYPGAELVLPGLRDSAAGRLTIEACLVSIARPVIEQSGLTAEFPAITFTEEPERALYRLLQGEGGNAYGRYNALVRRLVSFERAVRRAQSRAASPTES